MIADESFNLNSYQPQVKQGKISRNASKKVSSGSERVFLFFSFLLARLHGRTAWWFFAGYICVRGFHRKTRTPLRLCATLHATKTVKKLEAGEKDAKRARTSPSEGKEEGKKTSSTN